MTDNNSKQIPDKRIVCKYGVRCYQKNPEHQKKYKHPQRRLQQNEADAKGPQTKRRKVDTTHTRKADEENESLMKDVTNALSDTKEESTTPRNINLGHQEKVHEFGTTSCHKPYEGLNPGEFIKEKFLLDMPEDFYKCWEFCKNLNERNPSFAFKDAGLILCGPFDVLNGKFAHVNKEFTKEEFLVHWRYFRDPPEFQTVLRGSEATGYHIGYFRDDPNERFAFMACNSARKDGIFAAIGENIFAALFLYLKEKEKACNPFVKMKISNLLNKVKQEASKLNYSLERRTEGMKSRNGKIVARSFNEIGIVVPYNKKTEVGYRTLAMDDKKLRRHLEILKDCEGEDVELSSELDSLFNWTTIAMDECDFGTVIELGWNLLFYEMHQLNNTIARFLTSAYTLLKRDPFADIIQAHMKYRRKGCQLSILPNDGD